MMMVFAQKSLELYIGPGSGSLMLLAYHNMILSFPQNGEISGAYKGWY